MIGQYGESNEAQPAAVSADAGAWSAEKHRHILESQVCPHEMGEPRIAKRLCPRCTEIALAIAFAAGLAEGERKHVEHHKCGRCFKAGLAGRKYYEGNVDPGTTRWESR